MAGTFVGGRGKLRVLRTVGWLVVLLGGITLFAAGASTVRAHAILLRSTPAADAELTQAPATVEMWFSEPLEPGFSTARVLTSSGSEVPAGAVRLDPADPRHMILPVSRLEPGLYTVTWQTLSQADGHQWYGSFPFTVLNPDGSQPTGSTATDSTGRRTGLTGLGQVVARWLSLLGGVLFFGAPLFQVVVAASDEPEEERGETALSNHSRAVVVNGLWIAAGAIALGGWLHLVLQGVQLGGMAAVPGRLLQTRTGALLLARQAATFTGLLIVLTLSLPGALRGRERIRVALIAVYVTLMLLLLVFGAMPDEPALVIATTIAIALSLSVAGWTWRDETSVTHPTSWYGVLLLAALVLLTFSLESHAGTVPGSVWATVGDYVHLLAAGAWFGGLVILPAVLWRSRRGNNQRQVLLLVRRFSYLASSALFVLVLTGLFSSLVQLSAVADLWSTSYGRTLSVKLFLVACAAGIAFGNNRLAHRNTDSLHSAAGRRRFVRQVTLEAAVSIGILLSVAVLVQTTPPRATTQARELGSERPFSAITRAGDLWMHIQVTPAQVGRNQFWVHLYHQDGSPIGEVQLVRLFFIYYRETAVGQARAELEPLGENTFAAEGAYLSQVGEWDISIYVRRRGMEDTLTEVSLNVLAPAADDPWKNPIPRLPSGLLVAGVLVALGAIPLILRRSIRRVHAQIAILATSVGGLLMLGGIFIGISTLPTLLASTDTRATQSPQSIADGAALYQERCAACHGADGTGAGPMAAELATPPADLRVHVPVHTDRDLYGAINRGVQGTAMPSYERRLTDKEIWLLVDYLRTTFDETQ